MDIIDTHAHSISDDPQKYPIMPDGGEQSEWSKEHPITTEQLIQYMDEAGVSKTVLVQPSSVYQFDNSYVLDSVAQYPERLIGVPCIDPTASDASETLRYLIQERGMSGVRVWMLAEGGSSPAFRLDGEEARPFWQEAGRLDVPVAANVHRTALSTLGNVLTRYPNVRVLLDHLSNPSIDDGPPYAQAQPFFDLARYPNLWLKFSTENLRASNEGRSTVPEFFSRLVDTFGANRMLWGSNFPATWSLGTGNPYNELVDLPRTELEFLGDDTLRQLLGDTARSVYPELRR